MISRIQCLILAVYNFKRYLNNNNMKSRKSYFSGKTVPIDDKSSPILYPRYLDPSEATVAGLENGNGPGEGREVALPSSPKGVTTDRNKDLGEPIAQQGEQANSSKKRKKKRWSEEKKAEAKAERLAKQQAAGGDHVQNKKKKKEKKREEVVRKLEPEERVSGPSNAVEAETMRATLGFAKQSGEDQEEDATPGSFQFAFAQNVSSKSDGQEPKNEHENASENSSSSSSDDSSGNSSEQEEEKGSGEHLDKQQINHGTTRTTEEEEGEFIPRRIFVGGMPFGYTEEMVLEYWEYCGPIESLDLMVFPDTGRFKGIAFITFATDEAYESALSCDSADCDGQILKVQKCKADTKQKSRVSNASSTHQMKETIPETRAPAPKTAGYNVAYVGNIAFEASSEAVKALFEPYGVTLVRLHTDKDTGKPKGYAHVHFRDEESLDKAMALNGTPLMGRKIRVGYAQPKKNSITHNN
eukprot:jgi/Picsp_1/4802/NSC_02170-R1_protein